MTFTPLLNYVYPLAGRLYSLFNRISDTSQPF